MSVSKQHQGSTVSALERCKSFTFDVNQQAESLVQWEQRYNQHSHGSFNGYLDELKFGGIHFFEEFTNQMLQQKCSVKDQSIWLGFSLQPQRPKINNSEIKTGQIMTRPSNIEFELITPPDFHLYGLVLSKESLYNELTGSDLEKWDAPPHDMAFSHSNHYVCYELAKLINLLLSANATSPINNQLLGNNQLLSDNQLLGNNKLLNIYTPARIKMLTPLINSKIADLLAELEYDIKKEAITYRTKQRVIGDINNYIKQTNNYPLTITELCHISNVSRRSLQYCFKRGFGISPTQYIRNCRLNEIRRILLKGENNTPIADLSLNFGFFHIATFNVHYKQLFGETPTQTIQRSTSYTKIIK